jgi:hypothetical protein
VKGFGNRTTELYFDTLSKKKKKKKKNKKKKKKKKKKKNRLLGLLLGPGGQSEVTSLEGPERLFFGDLDIMLLHFLSWSGALLNPCDNAYRRTLTESKPLKKKKHFWWEALVKNASITPRISTRIASACYPSLI